MITVGDLRGILAELANSAEITLDVNEKTHSYKMVFHLGKETGYIEVGGPNEEGGEHDVTGITATGAD